MAITTQELKHTIIEQQRVIRELRAAVAKLQAEAEALRDMGHELEALREAAVHIYNSGYSAGHHYTVEGGYVDIHSNDMDSYHAEEVAELLAALAGGGK